MSTNAYGSRKLALLLACLGIIVILDIALLRTYDIISKQFVSLEIKETMFVTLVVTSFGLQLLLINILRPPRKKMETGSELISRVFYNATRILMIGLAALAFISVYLILSEHYYDARIVMILVAVTYALCVLILGTLVKRILKRLPENKTLPVIFLFVMGLVTISLNATVALIDSSLRLGDRPPEIRYIIGGSVDVSKGRYDALDDTYFYSYVASYMLAWSATAALLRRYSTKLGRLKYAILIAAPVVFFLFQFSGEVIPSLSAIVTLDDFELARVNQMIISLSKPVGGLMLGIPFWIVARFAQKGTDIRFFLIVTGFGMLLLFSSNQAILLSIAPYPPFGLATIPVLALSSYLVMIGLYRSSVTISNDHHLRRVIKQAATSEAMLIEGIISGEKRKEIEEKVARLVRQRRVELEEQSGSSVSMSEADVRHHLEQVLRETKKI